MGIDQLNAIDHDNIITTHEHQILDALKQAAKKGNDIFKKQLLQELKSKFNIPGITHATQGSTNYALIELYTAITQKDKDNDIVSDDTDQKIINTDQKLKKGNNKVIEELQGNKDLDGVINDYLKFKKQSSELKTQTLCAGFADMISDRFIKKSNKIHGFYQTNRNARDRDQVWGGNAKKTLLSNIQEACDINTTLIQAPAGSQLTVKYQNTKHQNKQVSHVMTSLGGGKYASLFHNTYEIIDFNKISIQGSGGTYNFQAHKHQYNILPSQNGQTGAALYEPNIDIMSSPQTISLSIQDLIGQYTYASTIATALSKLYGGAQGSYIPEVQRCIQAYKTNSNQKITIQGQIKSPASSKMTLTPGRKINTKQTIVQKNITNLNTITNAISQIQQKLNIQIDPDRVNLIQAIYLRENGGGWQRKLVSSVVPNQSTQGMYQLSKKTVQDLLHKNSKIANNLKNLSNINDKDIIGLINDPICSTYLTLKLLEDSIGILKNLAKKDRNNYTKDDLYLTAMQMHNMSPKSVKKMIINKNIKKFLQAKKYNIQGLSDIKDTRSRESVTILTEQLKKAGITPQFIRRERGLYSQASQFIMQKSQTEEWVLDSCQYQGNIYDTFDEIQALFDDMLCTEDCKFVWKSLLERKDLTPNQYASLYIDATIPTNQA